MQLFFTKQRDYVYTFKLNLPCSNDKILSILKQETWLPDQAGYAQNSFPTRYRLTHPHNPVLTEIQEWIDHGDVKKQIIDQLYQEPLFPAYWGLSQQRMMDQTFIYGIYTLDRPGYSIRIHTDDRLHVVQGMIYFILYPQMIWIKALRFIPHLKATIPYVYQLVQVQDTLRPTQTTVGTQEKILAPKIATV